MRKITDDLVNFIIGTEYADLPTDVIHEAKQTYWMPLGVLWRV